MNSVLAICTVRNHSGEDTSDHTFVAILERKSGGNLCCSMLDYSGKVNIRKPGLPVCIDSALLIPVSERSAKEMKGFIDTMRFDEGKAYYFNGALMPQPAFERRCRPVMDFWGREKKVFPFAAEANSEGIAKTVTNCWHLALNACLYCGIPIAFLGLDPEEGLSTAKIRGKIHQLYDIGDAIMFNDALPQSVTVKKQNISNIPCVVIKSQDEYGTDMLSVVNKAFFRNGRVTNLVDYLQDDGRFLPYKEAWVEAEMPMPTRTR